MKSSGGELLLLRQKTISMLLLMTLVVSMTAKAQQQPQVDRSWTLAYNAAWVRVKASGIFSALMREAFPGVLPSLRTLGDCPTTPEAFPFPPRVIGTVLDEILHSGQVRLAFQFNDPSAFVDDSAIQPGETNKALYRISSAIVEELKKAYNVPELTLQTKAYEIASSSIQAVVDGDADMTDMFHRQWAVSTGTREVLRLTQAQPSCTLWLATLSTSWIQQNSNTGVAAQANNNNWQTLEDLSRAGDQVIIPVTPQHSFAMDMKRYLPEAVFVERPEQEYLDGARPQYILEEFLLDGNVTVLLATKSEITLTAGKHGFNLSGYTLGEAQTPVDLPMGAFLRTHAATRTSEQERGASSSGGGSSSSWALWVAIASCLIILVPVSI